MILVFLKLVSRKNSKWPEVVKMIEVIQGKWNLIERVSQSKEDKQIARTTVCRRKETEL